MTSFREEYSKRIPKSIKEAERARVLAAREAETRQRAEDAEAKAIYSYRNDCIGSKNVNTTASLEVSVCLETLALSRLETTLDIPKPKARQRCNVRSFEEE